MKRISILLIAVILTANGFAQSEAATDTAGSEAAASKSALTLGATYSNNVNYYGQRAAEKMPYLLAIASWRHRSGFYLTGAAYKLLNDSGGALSASSVGAGAGFKLGTSVSADINLSHTFYPAASPFVQAANANNAGAGISVEKWITTTASVDYAFGKTHDVFATLSLSKATNIGNLFTETDAIVISPAVDVVAGTQHFYKTYITEKRLRDSIAGIPLSPILGSSGSGQSITTKTGSSFDLVSYNFKLPVAYSRASYQLELAWQLSVLDKKTAGSTQTNSFISASFYYQF